MRQPPPLRKGRIYFPNPVRTTIRLVNQAKLTFRMTAQPEVLAREALLWGEQ